jgi:hypothetical protein
MTNGSNEHYPIYEGVVMKPGVRVFIWDRDHPANDTEGTIVETRKLASGSWEFNVSIDGPAGHINPPDWMHWDQIWPTSEEGESESAKEWRAARRLKVFLCHGKEDKTTVRGLYQRLKDEGMKPWLDEEDIEPGAQWDIAIQDAVRDCHIVLVCLSGTSVGKTGYVQKEIKYALDRADEKPEGTTYIIPVKLEECEVPRRLNQWQWVNLYEENGYRRLLRVLKKHATDLKLY